MGREVRRVPRDWQHPKNSNGHYRPLYAEGYQEARSAYADAARMWALGAVRSYKAEKPWEPKRDYHTGMTYEDHAGKPPVAEDHMPDWSAAERTHYQMYETCSEGTPISPVMETPEALAQWLADNNASAFGSMTASYDAWLRMIKGSGFSIGAMYVPGEGMTSTVGVGED